jgi:hypothetical protein
MAALSRMRPRNRGTIINVGSALAYRAIPLQSVYCAAKFAVRGFTDSLRSELIHDNCGVNLVMVHLPAVNTPQFDWALNKTGQKTQPVPPIFQPEVPARAIATPLRRTTSNARFRKNASPKIPSGAPGKAPRTHHPTGKADDRSRFLRLYARALHLPLEYFDQPFSEPQYKLRMTLYPYQTDLADDEFGIAPYTDTSFLTLLAPNEVPGLAIRTQTGKWIDAPAISGAFVVNGGQLLQRWTNDYFLATPHRAINRSRGERYALAFFCDANIDWPIAAVATCVGLQRVRPARQRCCKMRCESI